MFLGSWVVLVLATGRKRVCFWAHLTLNPQSLKGRGRAAAWYACAVCSRGCLLALVDRGSESGQPARLPAD